jgi:hypothetical protein
VIQIRRHGDAVVPTMVCCVCKQALPISAAWMAFPALEPGRASADGKFVHRACADGNGVALLQSQKFMLWRGASLLERLLRG